MDHRITSVTNPKIKRLVELRKKARSRKESGLFLIEGTRLCMDTPPEFLAEVYVTENWLAAAPRADLTRLAHCPLTVVSEEVMAKAADTATPQGILCAAKMPSFTRDDLLGKKMRDHMTDEAAAAFPPAVSAPVPAPSASRRPLLLILEDIQDPGNLGTMFRTAEAAGATGILMNRGTVDLFNPKVVRATMSAIFRVPFMISDDLYTEIGMIKKNGITVYAAHLGGTRPYDALPLAQGSAFLIGNEGNGLSERAVQAADEKTIIPMEGAAESLNAAMAAGILLFEASRQRRSRSVCPESFSS